MVILDGAIGTELQNRGVTMDTDAWCRSAMLGDPGIIRTLHDDYIAAGWIADHGVAIVEVCCGLGPDHIRALRERVT